MTTVGSGRLENTIELVANALHLTRHVFARIVRRYSAKKNQIVVNHRAVHDRRLLDSFGHSISSNCWILAPLIRPESSVRFNCKPLHSLRI